MKISLHKKYQTRHGSAVELLTTRARGDWPVMGYIGGEDQVFAWSIDGVYAHSHQAIHAYDLVEVKPRRVMWLNVYPYGEVQAHDSREDADVCSGDNRIACLQVEFEEGDGP